LILKHRLKSSEHRPEIQVIKQYGQLPQVECYAGQLSQVWMNILANAIDALEDSNQNRSVESIKAKPTQITIKTDVSDDQRQVVIRIRDNGSGMTDEVKHRIFDYLFTTKRVGQGTGLGLAIAHQIVVEKHAGILEVDSVLGQGTEFVITISVKGVREG
jgi:signal transduction histidine kinase